MSNEILDLSVDVSSIRRTLMPRGLTLADLKGRTGLQTLVGLTERTNPKKVGIQPENPGDGIDDLSGG